MVPQDCFRFLFLLHREIAALATILPSTFFRLPRSLRFESVSVPCGEVRGRGEWAEGVVGGGEVRGGRGGAGEGEGLGAGGGEGPGGRKRSSFGSTWFWFHPVPVPDGSDYIQFQFSDCTFACAVITEPPWFRFLDQWNFLFLKSVAVFGFME
jgi:hypothetical protein